MQLLKRGILVRWVPTVTRRIERADIAQFKSAFFTNSACAALPISAIDDHGLAVDPHLLSTLEACLEVSPWEPI